MRWIEHKPMAGALTALAIATLASCKSVTIATDGYCRIFQPLTMSRKDTPATRRSIARANFIWRCTCLEDEERPAQCPI